MWYVAFVADSETMLPVKMSDMYSPKEETCFVSANKGRIDKMAKSLAAKWPTKNIIVCSAATMYIADMPKVSVAKINENGEVLPE